MERGHGRRGGGGVGGGAWRGEEEEGKAIIDVMLLHGG